MVSRSGQRAGLGEPPPVDKLVVCLFAAYDVEPDPERIAYYRRLWNSEDVSSR
ncbi:hypothetical protein [Mycobacterium branderi]|uniref:Uncharacterized protein n=1 Tax=Mycobacterium branderi TaxID=43348 RepID=A0ABM7KK83_9MYCO|nr:hypothetical protein [Mycobacterium branderi]BBZ11489.1 hypothetical protein MBRA_16840 [Mycobacterium branderi]